MSAHPEIKAKKRDIINEYTTKPAQAQGSRLPAMRHRSLNNFHKKWDNNKKRDIINDVPDI